MAQRTERLHAPIATVFHERMVAMSDDMAGRVNALRGAVALGI